MPASGVRLWLILWKAYDAMREHARRHIHSLGIGMTGFGVLEMLLHKGPLPVNVIGSRLRLTSGAITTAIDRLETKGLAERRNDPEDRRTRIVCLTPAGEALIASALRTMPPPWKQQPQA
jgi:MarR family 2-MHQ and catechol resistance regulon transcriptional repressor